MTTEGLVLYRDCIRGTGGTCSFSGADRDRAWPAELLLDEDDDERLSCSAPGIRDKGMMMDVEDWCAPSGEGCLSMTVRLTCGAHWSTTLNLLESPN